MRQFTDETYYWVKKYGEWFIAEFDAGEGFWLCGDDKYTPQEEIDAVAEEIPRKRDE